MSKQRNDQQPQSTSASDKKADDGEARNAGQDKTASSTAASTSDSSQAPSTSSPADSADQTDPIKPDVAKPATKDEPSSSKPAGAPSKGGGGASNAKSASPKPANKSAERPSSGNAPSGANKKAAGDKPGSSAQPAKAGKANEAAGSSAPDARAKTDGTAPPPPTGPKAGGGSGGKDKSGKLGLLALVLVVLLALVVVVLGYLGWQKLERQQAQLSQVSANRSSLSELESRVGDLDQSRQQTLNMMRGEFDQYRQNLDKTLDKVLEELAQQQQADPREWLHAEAEYLLRLANQRLQLERDVNGAKALLNAADNRLREADNPALVPIRRAIQSELAALDSVPVIDRTGIYLALMAQQEQLARLPLKQDIEEIAAGKGDAKPTGGWREQLATLGRELKDLVTVRRHDQPLEALITPEQESYLRQNVRLLLEQAQLALLKSEPKLYQASLDKARELIEGYYATDNDGVANSLEKLQSLRDKNVRPELPDISESSQLLKRFIEQRFGNADGSGGSQGGSARGEGA